MKTIAAFCRVSTDSQDVDGQRHVLTKWAAEEGHALTWYDDGKVSGRKSEAERPGLAQLMDDCRRGRVGIVAMTETSRLSRGDMFEALERLRELLALGVTITFVLERESFSGLLTPDAKFKLAARSYFAELERTRNSNRTQAKLEMLLEREKNGGPPSNIGNPKLQWTREADKELVRCIATGMSPEAIAKASLIAVCRRRAVDKFGEAAFRSGRAAVGYGDIFEFPKASALRARLKALGVDPRGVPVVSA